MEVTNGTVEPAHYGPIGDAARHVASYCDGAARVHVYTAAFTALAAKDAELAAERAKAEKLREALHDAICMIGHAMPMDTTVLAGQRLVARDVWQTGYDLLHPKPKKEIA